MGVAGKTLSKFCASATEYLEKKYVRYFLIKVDKCHKWNYYENVCTIYVQMYT